MKKQDNNKNPKLIRYGYLSNTVFFVPDDLSLTICVDPKKEKYPRKRKPTKARMAQIQEDKENIIRLFQQNQSDLAGFTSKYDMTSDFHHRIFQITESDMLSGKITPLSNVLSGASITLKYGEGLFEFLNTDFSSAYEAVRKELSGCQVPDECHSVAQQYVFTMRKLRPLFYQSLYTAVCPIVLIDTEHLMEAVEDYYQYVVSLQQEYRELFEFCFVDEFYNGVLGNLQAIERYHIYRKIHHQPDAIERKERYFYDFSVRGKDEARLGITQEELNNRYEKWATPSRQYRNFAEQYDLDMDELRLILAVPRFLHVDYRFSSLEELLSLEFTKMLDLNLRYTKCRRCGRLFPLKGNREAKYCENIAEGEMKTCRELAIQENYRAKAADKPERKIYSKYYKRYSARVKSGQITEEKFREWKYTAMTKRDECTNGKISVDELEAWMEESFTNRKKIG